MLKWRTEYTWILLTGIILTMTIWWFPGAGSITTDTFSVAHGGKKAFYQSLQRLESNVARSTDELVPNPGAGDRILILGPARYPTDKEWEQLREDVEQGGTVIFAASDAEPFLKIEQFGLEIVAIDEDAPASTYSKVPNPTTSTAPTANTPTPTTGTPTTPPATTPPANKTIPVLMQLEMESEELIADSVLIDQKVNLKTKAKIKYADSADTPWEVLVTVDGKTQVILRDLGQGQIMFISTDEMFSNEAMTHPDQALLAYRIIEATPTWGMTWFDETLNSSGVPKVLGILFDPLFRAVTLQLILIAVLFGWSGSLRYGPAAPPISGKRRSIVEHAEALGILYYRSKAGSHAVESMHEYLNLQLRNLYGVGFKVDNASALARQANMEEGEVRTILNSLKEAERVHLSNNEAAHLLKQLSKIIYKIRKD